MYIAPAQGGSEFVRQLQPVAQRVAREFSEMASYDQKLALMRCLFAVSATDESISTTEESEIHRIAKELRIDHPDLVALRVAYRRQLPGMSGE